LLDVNQYVASALCVRALVFIVLGTPFPFNSIVYVKCSTCSALLCWGELTRNGHVQVTLPRSVGMYSYAYMAYMMAGTVGMLMLNIVWFRQLVTKAKKMIERVNKGQSPTPDYDRLDKVD
jgi:hypothetical protein